MAESQDSQQPLMATNDKNERDQKDVDPAGLFSSYGPGISNYFNLLTRLIQLFALLTLLAGC